MCLTKGNLLDWLTRYSWVVPQWPTSCWGGGEHSLCSVHKAGQLSSPVLSLKVWRIPGVTGLQFTLDDQRSWVLMTAKDGSGNNNHSLDALTSRKWLQGSMWWYCSFFRLISVYAAIGRGCGQKILHVLVKDLCPLVNSFRKCPKTHPEAFLLWKPEPIKIIQTNWNQCYTAYVLMFTEHRVAFL